MDFQFQVEKRKQLQQQQKSSNNKAKSLKSKKKAVKHLMSQLFSHKENAGGGSAVGKSTVSPTNRPLLSASSQNLSSAATSVADGSSNTNIRSAIANLAPPPPPNSSPFQQQQQSRIGKMKPFTSVTTENL